jgi:hypothetical protein
MSVLKQADSSPTLRPSPVAVPVGLIMSASFSASGFAKRWSHCHQMANYFARFASANEDDPERYTTLLSTFFNEFLEAVYRNHAYKGDITISFERNGGRICLRAEVPIDTPSLRFYRNAVEVLNQADPMAWYRDRLERDAPDEEITVLGLLELAVVYDCRLSMQEPARDDPKGDVLLLFIDFPYTVADEP